MSQGFIGEKLGSFRLDEVLGSGAMGLVFKATHETTGRLAAVKIVHNDLGQKGKVFDRFEREAEILKQFRHPNIVRWYAWGRFKGTSYFAMEYVDGVTLERVLQERKELPWNEVVDFAIQLCDALHYAHEMSVVHRDLKPSNLMITPDGTLKLTDFGIAKDLDRTTQLTAPGRTLGTAAYMAPEQIRGTPAVSHKTDLYSLGVLLYQMLTGKAPFDGASAVVLMHCHLNEAPPRPSDKVEQIPKELDDIVVKLMAKSPSDRPWDAAAVGQVLRNLKEKAAKGETVSMVWPEGGSASVNPKRAPATTTSSTSKRGTKGGKTVSRGAVDAEGSGFLSRQVLEVSGMIAALLAIAAFFVYWLWPLSEAQLYQKAEVLMASTHRSDWMRAEEEYLTPLDRKYPNHPYKEQLRKWRDQFLLDEAQSRSQYLSSPVKTALSEPHTDGERQYVIFDTMATKAANDHNELQAVEYWRELARVLKPDDPEERKWFLLGNQRADDLEKRIQDRRTFVIQQLERANAEFNAGRVSQAVQIRAKLVDDYGKYTDLADLLGGAKPPAPAPPPDAQPATPPAEANSPR